MSISSLDQYSVSSDLLRFVRYCDSLRRGKAMANYCDFRPADVSWMLGKIYMMDVIDGGADYRFRLLGAALTGLHGCDHTGKRLSEVEYPGLKDALIAELGVVLKRREMLYFRGKVIWPGRESIGAEKLLVPMSGENGDTAVILGALHYEYPT